MRLLGNGKEKSKKQEWEGDNEYRFPISVFSSGDERSADRDKDCGRGDNKKKPKKNLEE